MANETETGEGANKRVGARNQAKPGAAPETAGLSAATAAQVLEAAAEVERASAAVVNPKPSPSVELAAAEPEEDVQLITRRSRRGNLGDVNFEVPENLKKPGWDYQWFTTRYAGMETEDAVFANAKEQGWRPVRPKDMPGYVSPDHQGNTVERFGQRLYMRPMHLTAEARSEDYAIANEQKDDKLAASSNVPVPDAKMRASAPQVSIEYEMGRHKPKAA